MSLVRVLLLTHAGLGTTLAQVVEKIYGTPPEDLLVLAPVGDDLAPLRSELETLIKAAHAHHPLLILCDIRGASPANALPRDWDYPWVRVVYGLSLPMLLRALSRRERWEGLAEAVAQGAQEAIRCHPESAPPHISALD